jgi:25S rRNA (cytosine2870-C5)-methyltransferase
MGRRAKNKQAPPQPLYEGNDVKNKPSRNATASKPPLKVPGAAPIKRTLEVVQSLDLSDSEDQETDEESARGDVSSWDSESDGGGMVTAQNMEKRSRALDRRARDEKESELKEQEMQMQQDEEASDGMEVDIDNETQDFRLPTVAERAEELQSGGVDLATVQRRIRGCTRVLNRFSKLAEPGR